MLANNPTSRGLSNSRRTTDQNCLGIDFRNVLPASSGEPVGCRLLLLVAPDVDILPIFKPLKKRIDTTLVADKIVDGLRAVEVCPHVMVLQGRVYLLGRLFFDLHLSNLVQDIFSSSKLKFGEA
jgi:hypothetical protein